MKGIVLLTCRYGRSNHRFLVPPRMAGLADGAVLGAADSADAVGVAVPARQWTTGRDGEDRAVAFCPGLATAPQEVKDDLQDLAWRLLEEWDRRVRLLKDEQAEGLVVVQEWMEPFLDEAEALFGRVPPPPPPPKPPWWRRLLALLRR